MLLIHYRTPAELHAAIGQTLKFWDDPKRTDDDYHPDGELMCSSPPGRLNFRAKVTMRAGLIEAVEIL